jgi:hypothetical protein
MGTGNGDHVVPCFGFEMSYAGEKWQDRIQRLPTRNMLMVAKAAVLSMPNASKK